MGGWLILNVLAERPLGISPWHQDGFASCYSKTGRTCRADHRAAQARRLDVTSELVSTADAYERALETSPDVILAITTCRSSGRACAQAPEKARQDVPHHL